MVQLGDQGGSDSWIDGILTSFSFIWYAYWWGFSHLTISYFQTWCWGLTANANKFKKIPKSANLASAWISRKNKKKTLSEPQKHPLDCLFSNIVYSFGGATGNQYQLSVIIVTKSVNYTKSVQSTHTKMTRPQLVYFQTLVKNTSEVKFTSFSN